MDDMYRSIQKHVNVMVYFRCASSDFLVPSAFSNSLVHVSQHSMPTLQNQNCCF